MRIILNSDVLYGDFSSHGLPHEVLSLAEACGNGRHSLVLPLTTVLEVKHVQDKIVQEARGQLIVARDRLANAGVLVGEFDAIDAVRSVDPVALFRAALPTLEVIDPTAGDYDDAHRRACLHEAPHPPNIKSDEMRDLVIWAMAIRLSREDGEALLLSRDEVHVNQLGNREAQSVGLVRLKSIDEALEYLEVKTPAGELLGSMLRPWWDALRRKGIPVGESPSLRTFTNVQFLQGRRGPTGASGSIKVRGDDAKIITADIAIAAPENTEASVSLENIFVDGTPHDPIQISAPQSATPSSIGLEERVQSLRDILGGNE